MQRKHGRIYTNFSWEREKAKGKMEALILSKTFDVLWKKNLHEIRLNYLLKLDDAHMNVSFTTLRLSMSEIQQNKQDK